MAWKRHALVVMATGELELAAEEGNEKKKEQWANNLVETVHYH